MTTDHTNDDQSAWSWSLIERTLDAIPVECVREHLTTPDGRWTMAHGHGWGWLACEPASETPEAPPAREPGWYWAKLVRDRWTPVEWCYERIRECMMAFNGYTTYAPDEVLEWGPRIDPPAKPTEPPPLPDYWKAIGGVIGNGETRLRWLDADTVEVKGDGIVPAAVMRHLLGLTAPVADVRALEAAESQLRDATESLGFVTAARQAAHDYARAVLAAHGITYTGKGAPL